MEKQELEITLKNYLEKNRNYLVYKYSEDAVQEGFLSIIKKNNKYPIKELNDSFIGNSIKWAFLNEVNNKNNNIMKFDDIVGSEDESISVDDIFGALDMKLENVVDNIFVEQTVSNVKDKNKKIIELFLKGYKNKEICKITNTNKSVVSKIINMKQGKIKRKEKRKHISKIHLLEFIDIMKPIAKETKSYYKLEDIVLQKDGRIFSKIDYFGGYEVHKNWYVSYVDKVDIEIFKKIINELKERK
jgi:RNA polymerase sigma factor (sigma-70 family)